MGPTQTPTNSGISNTFPGATSSAYGTTTPTPGTSPQAPTVPTAPTSFSGFTPPKPHGDIILESNSSQKKSKAPIIIILVIILIIIAGVVVASILMNNKPKDNSSADHDSPSSASSDIASLQASFNNFAKVLYSKDSNNINKLDFSTDINEWYIYEIFGKASAEDTVAYGQQISEEWQKFSDTFNHYDFSSSSSSESVQELKQQVQPSYDSIIKTISTYFQYYDTILKIFKTYPAEGADASLAVINSIANTYNDLELNTDFRELLVNTFQTTHEFMVAVEGGGCIVEHIVNESCTKSALSDSSSTISQAENARANAAQTLDDYAKQYILAIPNNTENFSNRLMELSK